MKSTLALAFQLEFNYMTFLSQQEINRISENDELRSLRAKSLIQEKSNTLFSNNGIKIPKVVIQYWDDLNKIPKDVKLCLYSWKILKKKGFKIYYFDDSKARKFISKNLGKLYLSSFNLCQHPAMRCDYFRLCYILVKGGFYVDADEFYQGIDIENYFLDNKLKIQPLCYNSTLKKMVKPDVFLQKKKVFENCIFYFNNNPIIAPPHHPIIKLALNRATNILSNSIEVIKDIQSTTGPGNLTACIIKHSLSNKCKERDYTILTNWEKVSHCQWQLSYRNDERNWRIWKTK